MIIGPSGRPYDLLPIDNAAGFPQRFPFLLNGVSYEFSLYANIPESRLGPIDELMDLPDGKRLEDQRFLVLRIDVLGTGGTQQTIFLRKVVRKGEYEIGGLALYFDKQIIARRNLNNPGNFGSTLVGGVTSL